MPILNIVTQSTGLVGVVPKFVYINTNDTLATVTTVGYLNKAVQEGFVFSESDMALVSTKTSPSATATQVSLLELSHSPSTGWSLVPSAGPGSVILPTVAGDFSVFSDALGTVRDLGYLPTDASKTRVVMQSGASVIGNFSVYSDILGTLHDVGYLPTDSSKTRVVMQSGASVIGDIPKYNDITGTLVDSGLTAASIAAVLASSGTGGVRSATVSSTGATASNVVTDPAISASSVVIARFVSSANVVTVQTVLPAAGQFTLVTDAAPSTCVIEYISFTPSAALLTAGVVVGKGSYGGGSATFVIADANITAGMVVTANFQSQVTPSKIYTATCGAGTITFVCSANPGVSVIEYAAMLPGDIGSLTLHAANYSYAGGFASIVISDASITANSIVTAEFKSQSVVALIQKVTPSAGTLTILASIDPGPSVVAYIATAAAGGGGSLSTVLPSGEILVGNASNVASPVAMSGDATLSNAGVLTLNPAISGTASVTVTAAQFNGAYVTPVQLVAAPGANKLIVVDKMEMVMTYGSAAFAAGGVVQAQYDNTTLGAGVLATNTEAAADFFATASTTFVFNGTAGNTVGILHFATTVNKGIFLSNQTGAFTTGTGSSFVVKVHYHVVTVA